ncbi:hypothetical protein KP509_25G038200 [Ceratopteris richardii]|nr:hypothetical protein KP509_25G038200 [Ceratopteris richardii]
MGETVRSLNDLSGVGVKLYASASFWLLLLLGVIAAFLPDWTLSKLLRQRAPEDYQIFQEMEHGWMDGVQSRDHGFVGPLPRRPSMVLQERDSHDAALLELMAFPTNKVRPSSLESDELPSRRRMTWREVLSDIDAEVVSQPDVQPGWARRVSNGFEVVTSHTDVTTVPRSLEEGPLPTHRRAV